MYSVQFLELLLFTQFLFLKKLKTYNDNPAATFTCSRIADLFTSKVQRVGIYIKFLKNVILQKKKVEFRVSKLQTNFFKDIAFFSLNAFSMYMVICLS